MAGVVDDFDRFCAHSWGTVASTSNDDDVVPARADISSASVVLEPGETGEHSRNRHAEATSKHDVRKGTGLKSGAGGAAAARRRRQHRRCSQASLSCDLAHLDVLPSNNRANRGSKDADDVMDKRRSHSQQRSYDDHEMHQIIFERMPAKKSSEQKASVDNNKNRGSSQTPSSSQRHHTPHHTPQHTPHHTPHHAPHHTPHHQAHTPRHQLHQPHHQVHTPHHPTHTPHPRTPQHYQKSQHHHQNLHQTNLHHATQHQQPKSSAPASQPQHQPSDQHLQQQQHPPVKHVQKRLPQIPTREPKVDVVSPEVPGNVAAGPRCQPETHAPRSSEAKAVPANAVQTKKQKPQTRTQLSNERAQNEGKLSTNQNVPSQHTSKKDNQDAMSCLPCRDKDMQYSTMATLLASATVSAVPPLLNAYDIQASMASARCQLSPSKKRGNSHSASTSPGGGISGGSRDSAHSPKSPCPQRKVKGRVTRSPSPVVPGKVDSDSGEDIYRCLRTAASITYSDPGTASANASRDTYRRSASTNVPEDNNGQVKPAPRLRRSSRIDVPNQGLEEQTFYEYVNNKLLVPDSSASSQIQHPLLRSRTTDCQEQHTPHAPHSSTHATTAHADAAGCPDSGRIRALNNSAGSLLAVENPEQRKVYRVRSFCTTRHGILNQGDSFIETGQQAPPPPTPMSAKHASRLLFRTTSIVVDPPPPEDDHCGHFEGHWPPGVGGQTSPELQQQQQYQRSKANNCVTHQLSGEDGVRGHSAGAAGSGNSSNAGGGLSARGHASGVNRSILRTQRSLSGDSLSSATPKPTVQVEVNGYSSVGKTTLIQQLMTSDYLGDPSNCQDDDYNESDTSIYVLLDGREVLMNFVEDASDHKTSKTNELVPNLDAVGHTPDVVLVVFSVTDRNSFAHASDTLRHLHLRKQSTGNTKPAIFLVANKQDLVRIRNVTEEECKLLAKERDAKYHQISAMLAHKLDELLVAVSKSLMKVRGHQNLRKLSLSAALNRSGSQVSETSTSSPSSPPHGAFGQIKRFFRRDITTRSKSQDSAV